MMVSLGYLLPLTLTFLESWLALNVAATAGNPRMIAIAYFLFENDK